MLVIDASVLVADLRPSEPYHSEAAALLDFVREQELAVSLPAIALAEVAGAISRGTRRISLAYRVIRLLQTTSHYQWIAVDSPLALRAASLAAEYHLRGYDAVYLALTQQLGASLVTLDDELCKRKPSDIEVVRPEEQLARLRSV